MILCYHEHGRFNLFGSGFAGLGVRYLRGRKMLYTRIKDLISFRKGLGEEEGFIHAIAVSFFLRIYERNR